MIKKIFYTLHKLSLHTLVSILSLLLFLTGIFIFINKTSKIVQASWYSSSWQLRQPISIGNTTGSTLTNEDVLLTIDTATLISAGKLQSACQDLRFTDSDDSTLLTYWIEAGCNTTTTQVWIRIPSLPNSGKTVYMYYKNSSAADGQASWTGNFTLLYNNSCPSGWTRNTNFDNRFPRGFASVGGVGGTDYHTHNNWTGNTSSAGDNALRTRSTTPRVSVTSNTHTHSVTISMNSVTIVPPYLGMVFCQKASLDINSGLIGLFDTSPPTGWTRFSSLDSYFPRGAATYGSTGGVSSHSHTTNATTTGNSSAGANTRTGAGNYAVTRTHNVPAQSTGTSSNMPPYLEMLYASANSSTLGTYGLISLADALPPLGWTRFSSLDSKFPLGAATYGGVGGTETHTHAVSITTDIGATISALSGGTATRSTNHTHTITFTTSSSNNIPPYYNTLFIQRKSTQSSSFNSEEGIVSPTDPWTEGQVNPVNITNLTPYFSAVYQDYGVGNSGSYYQVEVNTNSAFTGTIMWDSTKIAMTQILDNVRSQNITYNGVPLSLDGTTYYWRIKFWDQANVESGWSPTAQFTMKTDANSSDFVFNCLINKASDNSSLNVTWVDNSTTELNFEVQRSVNSGAWTSLTTLPANSTSYLDTDVSNGNNYVYQIAPIFSGPVYGNWCVTPLLNLDSGSIKMERLKINGIQFN